MKACPRESAGCGWYCASCGGCGCHDGKRCPAFPEAKSAPVPLVMFCPAGHQHIDEGEKPHKTHRCGYIEMIDAGLDYPTSIPGDVCGLEWTPANFPTVGVKELDEKK